MLLIPVRIPQYNLLDHKKKSYKTQIVRENCKAKVSVTITGKWDSMGSIKQRKEPSENITSDQWKTLAINNI